MREKNEKKNKAIYFRVSSTELERIDRKVKKSGLENRSEFILACVFNRKIKVQKIDPTNTIILDLLSRMISEINAIGKNANQVTKRINSFAKKGELTSDTKQILEELKKTKRFIEENKEGMRNAIKRLY